MGKRSTGFDRAPRDFYPTPELAVRPLIPHLRYGDMFVEPCAGDGALVRALERHGLSCAEAFDISPAGPGIDQMDVLEEDLSPMVDTQIEWIITNPPWSREILHPMIVTFSDICPTWLLFDADWMHTRRAIPYLPRLRKVVSIGRVKWIPDSPNSGKDNCCWYLFDKPGRGPIEFYGRS